MKWHRKLTSVTALLGILFVQLHGLWLHKITANAATGMMLCPMHSMMIMPTGEDQPIAPSPNNQSTRFCPIANARDHAAILTAPPQLAALNNTVLANTLNTETRSFLYNEQYAIYNARAPPHTLLIHT